MTEREIRLLRQRRLKPPQRHGDAISYEWTAAEIDTLLQAIDEARAKQEAG